MSNNEDTDEYIFCPIIKEECKKETCMFFCEQIAKDESGNDMVIKCCTISDGFFGLYLSYRNKKNIKGEKI